MQPWSRETTRKQLQEETFDLCIIGAGASGAGVALDAALRGYKVALIEKNDFTAETSSRSTKLIHGGVRYLEQAIKKLDLGQLRQVRHGLAERQQVIDNAPHLAKPLGIITPVFSWFEGFYFSLGLRLYGWFATSSKFPAASWLSKAESLHRIPTLSPQLHSSVLYFDGQLDDARYGLALVQSAVKAGAQALNYVEATAFEKDLNGKLNGVRLLDIPSGQEWTLRAKTFINCAGPYADAIRLLANPSEHPRIRPSKGVHLMVPKRFMPAQEAMLIPKTPDGRVIFAIPFQEVILIGTTDTAYDSLTEEPVLESNEIDYLLETLRPYWKELPNRRDIQSGLGGLRPLISASRRAGADTKTLLRDHEIERDESSGLFSLLGGKWTTYRLMAQDMMDAVDRHWGKVNPCQTAHHRLVGAQNSTSTSESWLKTCPNDTLARHFWDKYGDRSSDVWAVCQETSEGQEPIHPNYVYRKGEVRWAIRYEMAQNLRDFFARRLRWELQDWRAVEEAIPTVAQIFAEELTWDASTLEKAIESYSNQLKHYKKAANLV